MKDSNIIIIYLIVGSIIVFSFLYGITTINNTAQMVNATEYVNTQTFYLGQSMPHKMGITDIFYFHGFDYSTLQHDTLIIGHREWTTGAMSNMQVVIFEGSRFKMLETEYFVNSYDMWKGEITLSWTD